MALDCGIETIHWTDLRVMLQIVEYKEYFFCLGTKPQLKSNFSLSIVAIDQP